MNLKPLGHRVLIKPDAPPETSEGGLVLPQDHDHVSMSGTVVAVGKGSKALWEARQKAYAYALECCNDDNLCDQYETTLVKEAIQKRMGAEPTPSVYVGDRVVFSDVAGLNVTVDGESYIILNEDDVVLVESEAVA